MEIRTIIMLRETEIKKILMRKGYGEELDFEKDFQDKNRISKFIHIP